MGLLPSNIVAGIIRSITQAVIAAVFLMLGFAPQDWIAGIIGEPPWWLVHPIARLLILAAGVAIFLVLAFWERLFSSPLNKRRIRLVDNALKNLDAHSIGWLREHYAGGRPPDAVGEALLAVALIDRDYVGFTAVKDELQPIVAQKLRSIDARWRPVAAKVTSSFTKARSLTEPIHVIVLGLAIAIGGAVWQWRRAPQVDPKISALETQVATLQSDLAKARAPSPPTTGVDIRPVPTPSQKDTRIAELESQIAALQQQIATSVPLVAAKPAKLTEKAIRDLLDILKEAKDLIDTFILPTTIEIEVLVANSFNRLPEEGETKRMPGRLRDARNKMKVTVWDHLDKFVYKDHVEYPEYMRFALDLDNVAVKGELNRILLTYAEDIERLPDKPPEGVLGLIKPRYEETRRQSNLTYSWAFQARERINKMSNNLRTEGVTGYEREIAALR